MEEDREALLLAVFDFYDLPTPGYGERAARCPVHDDAHASASINRGRGLINCHACGFGGSAIDLVMVKEQLDYRGAREFIKNKIGVDTADSPVRPTRRSGRSNKRWVPPRLRNAR